MIIVTSQTLDSKGLPTVIFATPYGELVATVDPNFSYRVYDRHRNYEKKWFYEFMLNSFCISGQYLVTSNERYYFDGTRLSGGTHLRIKRRQERTLTTKQRDIWAGLVAEVITHMMPLEPDTTLSDLEESVRLAAATLTAKQNGFAHAQGEYLQAMDELAAERDRRGI